ncbi:MAG: hypothetical protein GY769_08560 [bacterium]|nr:hypothetical protein [bacterium]
MLRQCALDLTPTPTPYGRAAFDRCGEGVEYRLSRAAAAIDRSSVRGLGLLDDRAVWKLEPYRGSGFGLLNPCARSRPASRRVLVSEGLADTLRRELARTNHRTLSVAIGDRFEAYPTAEERFAVTRSILEVLAEASGIALKLTTRSPLILRDQDLLGQLDLNHSITVHMPIATLDVRLAAQMEPNASPPAARLEIARRLSRDGIAVIIPCPILPGINSSADELDPLFAAARRAGAIDVIADARLSSPRNRRRVAAWLERHKSDRSAMVLKLMTSGAPASHFGTLERLRLAHGFPALRSGRG